MKVYHFTEQPYPDAWLDDVKSLRITLPNRLCDPAKATVLLNRYLDEFALADELGLDIMLNEHHSTPTCLSSSVNVNLAILAKITKRARLLALGVPLANRTDPLRVAEELSVVDVISGGRLEMGFVKGVPYEVAAANSNPVRMMDRLWEAHDLILKAMTTHDGPFNWEGEYFHYRNVNIWPRPVQQPHPPVWITAMSPGSAGIVAERGHVIATFLTGFSAKRIFDAYKTRWREIHNSPSPVDRFAYSAICSVAGSESEALARADRIAGYLRSATVVSEPFARPPGYFAPADNAKRLKAGKGAGYLVATTPSGRSFEATEAPMADLVEAGLLFAGTPDQVTDQIMRFSDAVGGIGHMLLMMQGATLSHADTVDNLKRFSADVLPRLKQYNIDSKAA
jgi:alkanesulfonate monooxygenase SsuD/methylene tetrahydromethanopterin reductase-like flavin-dependent oxidoreductase (luciferase family)